MKPLFTSLGIFACFFGGSLIGMQLRRTLPSHHLSDDSKRLIDLGLRIIGTMAGVVLGLLVAAAAATYNTQRNEVLDVSSRIVLLDRILAHYGPEAAGARLTLKQATEAAIERIWPSGNVQAQFVPAKGAPDVLFDEVEGLSPKNDGQRALKADAMTIMTGLLQMRWLMYEQLESSISTPLLMMLVFWFAITFVGFGLFAPPNGTVVISLALCSLAVAGAVFLMLEMYSPFSGVLQIPSGPLRAALAHLGY